MLYITTASILSLFDIKPKLDASGNPINIKPDFITGSIIGYVFNFDKEALIVAKLRHVIGSFAHLNAKSLLGGGKILKAFFRITWGLTSLDGIALAL
jgi:hypothetical protein